MLDQAIDARTKWGQLGSAIGALLTLRGIRVGPSELDRTDSGVHVRTSVIEIDVAAAADSGSAVDITVRYMQRSAEGRSDLSNDGTIPCQAVEDLIDQCEAAALAADVDVAQQLDEERLDDDGGHATVEANK